MTARKRKSPERKKPVRQPGFLSNLLNTAGGAVVRHPKPLFGLAIFGVVFSFVAANALWYQPGGHPSPFLATRDAKNPNAIAGYRPMLRTAPADVTTFRIERADPNASRAPVAVPPTATVAAPAPRPQPTQQPVQQAAIPAPHAALPPVMPQQTAAQPAPQPSPAAPRPSAMDNAKALPALPAKPSQPLPSTPPKAVPVSRPMETVSAHGEDPVAAAIRAAERKTVMIPPADIPNIGRSPVKSGTLAAQKPTGSIPSTNMVLQIQRGLSNIAYADVEMNGVAGTQTKAAIRRFQKHYRLPETGEPDEIVLKKLRSIGAL